MNEVFYEDILETFIFCFLASLGIIQVMAARRGWHGLSFYGGRVRENVNNALGAALIIFAYAWYFSDPLHRNVRNIEALMSMVCLILGILSAAAFSCIAASLSESLRRRRLRRWNLGHGVEEFTERRVSLPGGTAVLHGDPDWTAAKRRLVIVGEPGGLSRHLERLLIHRLPEGTAAVSLWARDFPSPGEEAEGEALDSYLSRMLRELQGQRLFEPEGSSFLGLGWGADQLLAASRSVERDFRPAALVALSPVLPEPESMTLGDSLRSNTPWDALKVLLGTRPWREEGFRSLLRLWIPPGTLSIVTATALTASLHLRWWFLSGPLGGIIASLWVTYYLDRSLRRKRAVPPREDWERRMAGRLSALELHGGELRPVVILTGDQVEEHEKRPGTRVSPAEGGPWIWRRALRGKFLLDPQNAERLLSLLFPEDIGT
ncbi:hypothetical protein [Candidatus Solincola tengchongensis]|uniref:hypothetical protein n=1 Tax=Candidatus Solincola tengchongensis TaxID=2900693 RepID=UPI00257F080C|nr:hypothetical protein [Candidatus Solincola tengchongensis]